MRNTRVLALFGAAALFGCAPGPDEQLRRAATQGNMPDVKRLLSNRSIVNAKDKRGTTALLAAAENGHVDVMRELLSAGADVNAVRNDGESPFLLAVKGGRTEAAKLLAENGADVKVRDSGGHAAIQFAIANGPEMTSAILKKSPDQANVVDADGASVLISAAKKANIDVITQLLDAKAEPNRPAKDGGTALMAAAGRGQQDIIDKLLEAGADRELKDQNGRTAAQYAREGNHNDLARALELKFAEGIWQGTTSQGKPIRFRVRNGHLDGNLGVTIAMKLPNPYGRGVVYSGTADLQSEFPVHDDVSKGRFEIAFLSTNPGGGGAETFLITGKVIEETSAAGNLTYTPFGGRPIEVTWKARRAK